MELCLINLFLFVMLLIVIFSNYFTDRKAIKIKEKNDKTSNSNSDYEKKYKEVIDSMTYIKPNEVSIKRYGKTFNKSTLKTVVFIMLCAYISIPFMNTIATIIDSSFSFNIELTSIQLYLEALIYVIGGAYVLCFLIYHKEKLQFTKRMALERIIVVALAIFMLLIVVEKILRGIALSF